jgi:hypothetical protein
MGLDQTLSPGVGDLNANSERPPPPPHTREDGRASPTFQMDSKTSQSLGRIIEILKVEHAISSSASLIFLTALGNIPGRMCNSIYLKGLYHENL